MALRRDQPCADCGVPTWPHELFMVTDAAWAEAGEADGSLCVGCLEARLDRQLAPDDFPPLPLNDDDDVDSVRLRTRKGSGRRTGPLYGLGVNAVHDLGIEVEAAAGALGIDAGLLAQWVENRRVAEELSAL